MRLITILSGNCVRDGQMSKLKLRSAILALFAMAAVLPAQELSDPVVLIVEVADTTGYRGDTSDYTKLATVPGPTVGIARTFQQAMNIGDIRAVNGEPAKGLWVSMNSHVGQYRAAPASGEFIADIDASGPFQCVWNIHTMDGTWVGSLFDRGQDPPGVGHVIVGGGGAFTGVVGEHRLVESLAPARAASTSEDPSMRRINRGGRMRLRFILYPRSRPAVQVTATGPAISHSDYSPVTATNPARPGELLILAATGLGPVRPNLDLPGSIQFSGSPFQEVNSPISVVFNGKELPVISKIGWPGQKNVYWVDFQVPSDAAAGTATLQLIAAWIPGPTVTIPVGAR